MLAGLELRLLFERSEIIAHKYLSVTKNCFIPIPSVADARCRTGAKSSPLPLLIYQAGHEHIKDFPSASDALLGQ
jgi:hypothetical protein